MDGNDADLRSPASKRSRNGNNLKQPEPEWRENCLRISNLPDKFMEATFCSFLEKYRIRKGIFTNQHRTIVKCEKHLKNGYVCVEFNNRDIVEALGSRTDAYFQKKYLVLEAPIYLNETLTDSGTSNDCGTNAQLNDIVIKESDNLGTINDTGYGAPADDIVMSELANEEIKYGLGADAQVDDVVMQESVSTGTSYDVSDGAKAEDAVMSELALSPRASTPKASTAEVVHLFKKLTPFKKNLSAIFKDVTPEKSDVNNDWYTHDLSFQTEDKSKQKGIPTSSVKICNLTAGFDERDIIYEINKALWKNKVIEKPLKPIICSDTVDDTTLMLTFDCPEHATLAVNLPQAVEYADTFLTLEQIFQEPMKQTTNKVKISQLPVGFEARDVVYEVHKALWKYTKLEKQCKPIINWETDGDTALILTFDSCEHAALAIDLPQSVDYDDSYLKMEPIYEDVLTPECDTEPLKIDGTEEQSWSGVEECAVDNSQEEGSLAPVLFDDKGYPSIPLGIVPRTDWPTFETLKLIEAMLKFREKLTHRNTHFQKEGYIALGKFMYERKLFYTARNLKGKIKALLCTYQSKSMDPSWEYRKLIAMYLAEEPFDASVLTEMFAKYKPSSVPIRRSLVEQNKIACGVVILANCNSEELPHLFDDKNTFMLIASYNAFKPLFDDDLHRSDELYAEISSKLKKFGCNVTGEDCSKRMGYLAKKYKEIEDMRLLCTGTGADVTNWIYYDAMSQLFEKSRVMNPQKLLAAGSASLMKSRKENKVVEEEEEDEDDDFNNNSVSFKRGKKKKKRTQNSYSSTVPTVSFKERKLQQGKELVGILKDLTQGLIKK